MKTVLVKVATDSLPNGCILPHEGHTPPTQRNTNLLHLVRAHIVDIHNESFWIFVKERLKVEDQERRMKIMTCP